MRAFGCPRCHQLVSFENSLCLNCGTSLGYLPQAATMVALAVDEDRPPQYEDADGASWVPCANLALASCNWLVLAAADTVFCESCALTRTRPADDDADALVAFARVETAKRRLVFQLNDLGLPVVDRATDGEHGLAFDLLSSRDSPVVTGHDDGVVTLDLAEADDPRREARRVHLGEAYRTLLGHLRHEVGHYFWDVLVGGTEHLDAFRELFGDESVDYGEALQRHYAGPPDPEWPESFVSSYATSHPWEDWAETFAHYLHIQDTLQTASAYGISVAGPDAPVRRDPVAPLSARPVDDLAPIEDISDVIRLWLPLTYALNAVNRSMGRDDLYPFVIPPAVVAKLGFVHDLVRTAAGRHAAGRRATDRQIAST